jgi:hypothetical protein
MKKHVAVVALLTLLFGFAFLASTRGQAVPPPQAGAGPGGGALYYPTGQNILTPYRATPAQSEIAKLMHQLRETEDEEKKGELTKQLETAVAKHFDEDMKARQTELTKLEERLKKLRAQLDRRSKAKAEIIQLQIKVLINEAEGLGFSGGSPFDSGVRAVTPVPAAGLQAR